MSAFFFAVLSCTKTPSGGKSPGDVFLDKARQYSVQDNHVDAIKSYEDAVLYFKENGDSVSVLYALVDAGREYVKVKDWDEAEKLYKTALYKARSACDTVLEAKALASYADLLLQRTDKNPSLALRMFTRAANQLNYALTPEDKADIAYAYTLTGDDEKGRKWIELALSSAQGDEATIAVEELQKAKLRTWILVLIFVLYAVAAVLVYRNWKLRSDKIISDEKAENERLMGIADDLQGKISELSAKAEQEKTDSGVRSKPLSLGRLDALQRLCEQYYIYEGTENLQPKILKEVKSIIEELRADPTDLEKLIDENNDGAVSKLRKEFPKLKEEDVRLFCFVASGFSATTIATLTGKEKQYVYNRIYRLRNRISDSEAPDKDLFISCLS